MELSGLPNKKHLTLSHLAFIHSDINHSKGRHSCESRNPEKHWIPGRARNDKPYKTYVVMYRF
jgi:hypothetical protein